MSWKLLIVEDDDDVATSLVDVLSMRGYRVWRARHGREAIDTVARDGVRPDAILLDLVMPVMDGAAFLEARREHPLLVDAPVIVMTAQPAELERVHAPIFERVDKPTPLARLLDAVSRACHADR